MWENMEKIEDFRWYYCRTLVQCVLDNWDYSNTQYVIRIGFPRQQISAKLPHLYVYTQIAPRVQILCTHWLAGENNCHAIFAVYLIPLKK